MTHQPLDRFTLVGYRFKKLLLDEEVISSFSKPTELQFIIATDNGTVTSFSSKGRQVIEIKTWVSAKVKTEGEDDVGVEPVMLAHLVARFVSNTDAADGDIKIFRDNSSFISRTCYLLVRQRLVSMLSSTMFRGLNLPYDISELETHEPSVHDKLVLGHGAAKLSRQPVKKEGNVPKRTANRSKSGSKIAKDD